jgi:2-hydroxychromene-2-carboxylate isomerase
MRGCVALADDTPRMLRFARAVFEAYWGEQRDISQDAELSAVSARAGIDPAWLFEAIAQPAVKAQLKANTDELIARGGFGSPTMFVNGTDMFFGNDTMPLVRQALLRG